MSVRGRVHRRTVGIVAVGLLAAGVAYADVDTGVIRLGPSPEALGSEDPVPEPGVFEEGTRRGFDYEAFGARLEGLWFQRKVYLEEGRVDEASRQADLIRAFVAEEGVRRLQPVAGALIAEAARSAREGNAARALASLSLAESLDPGRPQVRFLRARVLWSSQGGILASAGEAARGLRAAVGRLLRDPSRLQPFALALVVAILLASALFASLMAIRYQRPLRHEVEEWMTRRGRESLAVPSGWAVLLAPLVLVVTAGWTFFYWIAATLRFMKRSERVVAAILLLAVAGSIPGYRFAVGLYGRTADPRVRTVFAAASGAYDPELIVKLRELVETYPDDPTYRFLLAGLYKDGKYFEEAYEEYRRVLTLAPSTWQAYVNIGNLFLETGQYSEAIAQYRKALDIRPGEVLPLMNIYQAQTESFRLNEAAATLEAARRLDPSAVAKMLAGSVQAGSGATVQDAAIDLGSVWGKVLEGRRLGDWLEPGSGGRGVAALAGQAVNPISIAVLLFFLLAVAWSWGGRSAARQCIRCGRSFCGYCKSAKEAPEYCSQCVHLFVLGDGLAAESKTRKMYEVEAHEKRRKILVRLASLVLPGAGHVLGGRALIGALLLSAWASALLVALPTIFRTVERALGLGLPLDVLRAPSSPPVAHLDPSTVIAVPVLVAVWIVGNARRRRIMEI